ncbi:MAG: phospholipid-binding protein MlaC [Tolumonas sp.]|nr:phospholipid-binding protein MlaC [Tolumonas sp.]
MFKWVSRSATVLLMFLSAQSFAINAQDPYLLVKDAAGKTFTRLEHDAPQVQQDPNHLRTIVREELLPYVDNKFAAYKVIGQELKNTTPPQRERFVKAFTDYIVATYADALGKYDKQQIKVESSQPLDEKKEVSVKVTVLDPEKPEINVVFQLRKNSKTGEWKVFDMIAEGVSLLSSKQSELGGSIRQKGIDSVSSMLEQHNRQPATLPGKQS